MNCRWSRCRLSSVRSTRDGELNVQLGGTAVEDGGKDKGKEL